MFAMTTPTPERTPSRRPAESAAMLSQTGPAVRNPARVSVRAPIVKSETISIHARVRYGRARLPSVQNVSP
jgi:hypothetical protein